MARDKVMAYIFREKDGAREILVFDHLAYPEVNPQVIAGSVKQNEDLLDAIIREVFEESGQNLKNPKLQGSYHYIRLDINEDQIRHVFSFITSGLPDSWKHTVSSGKEDKGLEFYFYWMSLRDAKKQLVSKMGDYIIL